MMVQMLVSTGVQSGAFVHAGDVVDADAKTAKRWIARGIAKVVTDEMPEVQNSPSAEVVKSDSEEVQSSSSSEVVTSSPSDIPSASTAERKKSGKSHKEK